MSLNYQSLSSNVNDYIELMITRPNHNLLPDQSYYPPDTTSEYEWVDNAFAIYYDQDSMNGSFSMGSVVMTSNQGILKFRPDGVNCSGSNGMARAIADYWKSQLTPGAPQVCGAITGITNDAEKIYNTISNYMCSYPGGIESNPPYEHLFSYIESQVKSIVWTVSEAKGTCNTSYSVAIS